MSRAIEALYGAERVTMTVPGHLLGHGGGDHYVLKVVGDSMIEEGVLAGDFVVCQRVEPLPGDMVVALVGDEATLKRYYPEGEIVRLQPANPALQAIRLPAGDVKIQAVVVGLMRRFERGGER